jgi:hypothetical protein
MVLRCPGFRFPYPQLLPELPSAKWTFVARFGSAAAAVIEKLAEVIPFLDIEQTL